jgi:hypothetical protein
VSCALVGDVANVVRIEALRSPPRIVDASDVAESVTACIATGVAGLSIEPTVASTRPARRRRAPGAQSNNPRVASARPHDHTTEASLMNTLVVRHYSSNGAFINKSTVETAL